MLSFKTTSTRPFVFLSFLYETRTICSSRTLHRSCFRKDTPTRGLRSYYKIPDSKTVPSSESPASKTVVTTSSRAEDDSSHKEVVVRYYSEPLKNSRKNLKHHDNQSEEFPNRLAQDSHGVPTSDQTSFDDAGLMEDLMFGNEARSTTATNDSEHRSGISTITPSEKQTFLRIFSDIRARSTATAHGSSTKRDLFLPPDQAERREGAEQKLVSILGRAAEASPKPIAEQAATEEEKLKALEAYPPALRKLAARAIGLRSEDELAIEEEKEDDLWADEDDGEASAREIYLKEKRTSEYERIEAKMRAAATDVELWTVMEQEVFALIERLGMTDENTKKKDKSKKRRQRNKKETNGETTPLSNTAREEPLDLEIYGPLYPSFLLLGFRLLERSFAKPSPLVNSVVPRIKSMGLLSHVLGASTALYNEQLRVMWFRSDDFLGALNLLKEMEQAGLEFDEETFSIVRDIHRMQMRTVGGLNGEHLRTLWSLPEFASGKFKSWQEKIQQSLVTRAAEYSQR